MHTLNNWFWRNIFIIGLLAIEAGLCWARPRRRRSLLKWSLFTLLLLSLSSLTAHNWQWSGGLMLRANVLQNSAVHLFLVYLSSLQLFLCLDMDLWNALFVTQVAASCQTAQFGVYKLLEMFLVGELSGHTPKGTSVCINLATLLLSLVLVYHLFGRGNRLAFHPDKSSRYVILLAAFLNLADVVLNGILYTTDPNVHFGPTMVATRLYSILFHLITLYLLYNLIIRRTIEREQASLQEMIRLRERQYHFSKELIHSIDLKSHDLKKQLQYLKSTASQQGDFLKEVETLTQAYDATIHTENPALSAVLTEKSLWCLEKKIPFSYIGSGEGMDFLHGLDIYTLFANLLDNAIEASLAIEEGERSIQLVVKRSDHFLSIHQENRFSGNLREEDGILKTLKANARDHGFGYRSMEEIVDRYEGSISHRVLGKTFVVNILLPITEGPER